MFKKNEIFLCLFVSAILHMTILYIAFNIGTKNNIYLSSQTEVVFYSASEQISDQSFNKFFENNKPVEDSKDEAYDQNDIKPQEEEVLKEDIVDSNDDVVDQKAKTKKAAKQKNTQSQAKKEKKSSDKKNTISIKAKEKKVSKNTQQTPKVIGSNSNIQTHRPDSDSSVFGFGSQYEGLSFENKDFKFSYYANQIVGKIKRHWNWSLNYSRLRTVIYFKIHKNGSVSDILVKKSSKNSEYDKFAADTIIRASPFPELPEGYPENFLGVYFEFVAN
jgi:TonB family protein